MTQDLEERARIMKLKMKLQQEGGLSSLAPHHYKPEYDHYGSRGSRGAMDYHDRHDRSMPRDLTGRSQDRGYDRGRDGERGHRSRRNKGQLLTT